MPNSVVKIVSGGQTGADRAALDFAIENGIEYGGFVPHGRLAEDGVIPERYAHLTEAATSDPTERTRLNVLSADCTILITHGPAIKGSKQTEEFAHSLGKPFLHIDLASAAGAAAAETASQWLELLGCQTLNIAGPRASEDKEIYSAVKEFLDVLFQNKRAPFATTPFFHSS